MAAAVPPAVAEYAVAELAALKQPSAGVDERAAFEAVFAFEYEMQVSELMLLRIGDDYVNKPGLRTAWWAWQARAQLAAPAGVPDGWKSAAIYAHQLADMVLKGDAPHTAQRTAAALITMLAAATAPAPTVEPAHSDDVSVPRELMLEAIAVLMLYTRGSGSREGVLIGDFRARLNGGRS